jgi:hypothetical protein
MGCFDVTCGISNTSIQFGDECVLVILNDKEQECFRNIYWTSQHALIQAERPDITPFSPILAVASGIYNDYGSIEDDSLLPENFHDLRVDGWVLYFHKWAVEYLFPGVELKEIIANYVDFAARLFNKLYSLRKSPFDLQLIGSQHDEIEEYQEMISLNEKINEQLKIKITEQEKLNKQYEEENA